MVGPEPRIKILMLHGFAQSGPFFQIKTRALSQMLRKTVGDRYNVSPEDVELVFPTAPLRLRVSDLGGTCAESQQLVDDSDTWAWWRNLDATNRYIGIESSLAALSLLIQKHGPFTGVVGFSQGATLAAMLASWCESSAVPGRREALLEMSHDDPLLSQLLSCPPQCPLDFAVCFSGFRGTPRFYHGFYAPEIVTPTIHILGELDTMITKDDSEDLIALCFEPKIVHHQGVHFVPRDVEVLDQVSRNLESIIINKATASVSYTSLLLHHEGYRISLPSGNNTMPTDIQGLCKPHSSRLSSETASDGGCRPRSRGAHAPRIVRRYRLS